MTRFRDGKFVDAKIGDWMKSPAFLANAGHVMAGALVTLVMALFHPGISPHAPTHLALWIFEGVFVTYVLVKEYVVDLLWESDEDWKSSTVDALGYFAGHGAAWLLVWLAAR